MNIFKLFNLNTVRKEFLLFVSCFLFVISFSVSSVNAQAGATFDRMWIDYDTNQENQKGMLLHTKFTAKNLKGVDCQVRILFSNDDETPLKDNNKRFYTNEGNVGVFRDLKPGYEPTAYEDLQIFMPYDELDLAYGEYNLKMDVDLVYKNGDLIQHLTLYPFRYSKKAPATTTNSSAPATPTESSTPTATFDSMWVEYDITEGDKRGMRIHIKYTVAKMKGTKGYVVFFIEKNGMRLKSYDNKFQSKGNDVAVYKSVAPAYDPAAYSDYTAFIPYEEFHLTPGAHDLKIDADLIYEDGKLIQHLGFKDFRYTKP